MNTFIAFLSDYTLQTVAMGTAILGIVSGTLGSFAVLRKQSLLGDAISHAALPGIALAFMLTLSKSPWILLLGAALAGWIGTLLMHVVVEKTSLKKDAALGIILSVFFGVGLVLLTIVQKIPTAKQAGLDTFLFGSAATLLRQDITVMLFLGSVTLLLCLLFYKEFKLITFDAPYAATLGFPVGRLQILLTSLLVMAIVIGLQTVGVVLMSAMIIAPAASARQWTDKLSVMIGLSALIGALSGTLGALLSSSTQNLPTGPTIVLVMSVFVLGSLLFAPNRGLLFASFRHYANRKKIRGETMLLNMLLFTENHRNPYHAHDLSALEAIGKAGLNTTLTELEKKGWITMEQDHKWALTPLGLSKAQTLQGQDGKLP